MVRGNAFRKTVFWCHLVTGVTAGLVVLMMSITGVLLTYERQIVAWVDASQPLSCQVECRLLGTDEIYLAAVLATGNNEPTVTLFRDQQRPVVARAGRGTEFLIDPFDGSVIREGASATDQFFAQVMGIHRWFALQGDARGIGRAVTGYSNLLFLFLLVTGIYLWLPAFWTKAMLRVRMLLKLRPKSSKARDFNWHHVFAFWAVIPLFVIITTATVFYFDWSNRLVYAAFGETPPERGAASESNADSAVVTRTLAELKSAAESAAAENGADDWRSVAVTMPKSGENPRFQFDRSIGGQPAKVVTIEVEREAGQVATVGRFADRTPGQQARATIRFLHTGEVLGVIGQTVAGLASLAACLLVWSGLALAWRRLIQPILRRRKPGIAQSARDAG